MNREKIEKEKELEREIAERSRKSLEQASKQEYAKPEATSVKVKEKEEKEFKTPGENYEKNADRIQISSGGKEKSEAMKRFEEKKERLKDKTEAKMKEMEIAKSKSFERGR